PQRRRLGPRPRRHPRAGRRHRRRDGFGPSPGGRLRRARAAAARVGAMIKVLLADDQSLVRAGFRMILRAEADIDVVGEAADGREAVAKSGTHRPDVVLMDVRMPEMNGIEATRAIATGEGAPRVVVLTTFDRDEYV